MTGRSVGKPAWRFNLKFKGRGIRFPQTQSSGFRPKRLLPALLLVVATGAAGTFYFFPYTFGSHMTSLGGAKNDDEGNEGELPPALEQTIFGAEAKAPARAERPVVRFGVFPSRESAERLAASLQRQDIFSDIRSVYRPAPAFTVRALSAKDGATLEKISSELGKINVALTPMVEQEYIRIGPLWTKEGALEAAKKMGELGFRAAVDEGSAEREMFEVVSQPLDDETVAKYKIIEWRGKGFEGAIEK